MRERRERSLPSFSLISPPHRQGIGNGGERERWPVSLLCSLSSPSGPFTPYRRSTGIERRGDEGMGPVTWLVSRLLPSRHSPLCSRSSHDTSFVHSFRRHRALTRFLCQLVGLSHRSFWLVPSPLHSLSPHGSRLA